MAATIAEVLGYTSLLEAIENIKKGIPSNMPPGFSSITENVLGNTGRFVQTPGTRQTSRLSHYGAPAHKRALVDIGRRDVMLIHSFEELSFDPMVLQNLMKYNDYAAQNMGEQEVARQVGNFTELFVNLRKAVMQQVLVNGKVYFDDDGNLLPTSSGASVTVDFGRSANNENQLNSIIAASWALAGTDIPSHLRNLRVQAAKDHGYELKYAFYGKNIPTYLTQNDYVLDYLSRNPVMQAKFLESAEIPAGLFGFVWVPVYTSFFEDATGTNREIWGGDNVVFTPEPDRRWWSVIEGSYPVPTNINIINNAEAFLSSLKQVYGMFGYSQLLTNPPSVATYMGDTFLPTMKNPNVTYAADVTP
jgi:hypothetical protein